MADYIERQSALDLVESAGAWGWSKNQLYEEIQAATAANVREDVQGEWIFPVFDDSDENDPRCKCSVCGSIETPLARHNFCPNCGARMTGGGEQ